MHKWDPDDYEKSSSAQYRWAMDLASRLALRGDERVLDIGCGDGKITAELASRVPMGEVLGIDLSSEMVDFARRKYHPEICTNLAFRRGDANKLDFDEEFDLVVSFACLHWVKDHLPVLEVIKELIHRSMKAQTPPLPKLSPTALDSTQHRTQMQFSLGLPPTCGHF